MNIFLKIAMIIAMIFSTLYVIVMIFVMFCRAFIIVYQAGEGMLAIFEYRVINGIVKGFVALGTFSIMALGYYFIMSCLYDIAISLDFFGIFKFY